MIDNRAAIAESVRRWGCSASISLLDPVCKIFSVSHIEGHIGYRIGLGCVMAYGDPVCPANFKEKLVKEFHEYCHDQKWRNIIYMNATERFAHWAMSHVCTGLVEIGQEFILNPLNDFKESANGRKLRNKISHAQHAGVTVLEYLHQDQILEKSIEQVAITWLKSRRGPQIYFSHVHLFADRIGKRWFYAQQGEQILGVLQLNQQALREGWLVHFLMTTPEAPQGTSEQLILTALETLRQENCYFLTSGPIPGSQLGEIKGFGLFSSWLARTSFGAARKLFHLQDRKAYWQKFHPNSEPTYFLFTKPRLGLREMCGVMRALNVSLRS